MSPIQTPESVPTLFHLIKPKEKRYLPAFYQALTETLVADSLEQANRIAYGKKRYRVVTLDGKLIDTSGTMSGGGSRPRSGGMSSKFVSDVSSDSLEQYEKEKEELETALDAIQTRQARMKSDLSDLKSVIPKLMLANEKAELHVKSLRQNIEESEARLVELRYHYL